MHASYGQVKWYVETLQVDINQRGQPPQKWCPLHCTGACTRRVCASAFCAHVLAVGLRVPGGGYTLLIPLRLSESASRWCCACTWQRFQRLSSWRWRKINKLTKKKRTAFSEVKSLEVARYLLENGAKSSAQVQCEKCADGSSHLQCARTHCHHCWLHALGFPLCHAFMSYMNSNML
jgi:hypothetical protein